MTTRVFVPDRFMLRTPFTPVGLARQFVELERSDVTPALLYWNYVNKQQDRLSDEILYTPLSKARWPESVFFPKTKFHADVGYEKGEPVCHEPVQRLTLTPFLWRPHVHINLCSKPGHEDIAEKLKATAFEAGVLTARHACDLWTGGSSSGNMKDVQVGFEAGRAAAGLPDHNSVQAISLGFILGMGGKNKSAPTNNACLPEEPDVTLITDDFSRREHVLQDWVGGLCVARINLIGGVGTINGLFNQFSHSKTGHDCGWTYLVNDGWYDGVWEHIEKSRRLKIDAPDIKKHVKQVPHPAAAFHHLRHRLMKRHDPERLYRANKLARPEPAKYIPGYRHPANDGVLTATKHAL